MTKLEKIAAVVLLMAGALAIPLCLAPAEAQPMPTCSPGQSCKVLSLTATKVTGLGIGLTGDAGVRFGDGTIQNTAATTGTAPSMATFGSTPNANGGSFSSSVLTLQPADGSNPGGVTAGTQTIGGNKTFSGSVKVSSNQLQCDLYEGNSGATTLFEGNVSAGASKLAVAIGNSSAQNTPGDQLISWRNGSSAASEFAYTLANGVSSEWTQHPVTGGGKRVGGYTITLNTDSTFSATNLPAPSILTAGVVASSPTVDGTLNLIDYPTTSSANNASGIAGPYTDTRFDFRPRLTAVVRTGATITNENIFVGLADADVSGLTVLADFNSHRVVGAIYSTSGGGALGGGNWTLLASDGTTASASASSTAVAVSTTYIIDIDMTRAGGAIMRINNSAISGAGYTLQTTNIPTGATNIGIHASATTLNAAVKDFYIGKIALEQN